MNRRLLSMLGTLAALVAGEVMLAPAAAAVSASAGVDDVQVLTRGPVHEAFAETVNFQPQPGMMVRAIPPAAVEELPPEQKPDGANVIWISGYWAWDDEQNQFIWVSGIWRNVPPGRQWVPGYWRQPGDGQSQWISGYWADTSTAEVTYIPTAPPASLEAGPNTESPSEDHSWIPGNWVWLDNRYAWRPGGWLPQREDWTWVPARYCWSPGGYIYVDGYWDYAVDCRGVLFAPVCFPRPVYDDPGYYYTPSIVIAADIFANHLFVRPYWGHYYFGDYYDSCYRDAGYYASFAWNSRHCGYDPIHAHDRWRHRHEEGWENRRHADFGYFRDHADARPAHTWAAMRDGHHDRFQDGRNRVFASTLASVTGNPAHRQRFSTLDRTHRDQFVAQNKEVRQFSQERRQSEAHGIIGGNNPTQSARHAPLARSPISGRQEDRLASADAPPKRPEARGTNLRVNPAMLGKSPPVAVRNHEVRDLAAGAVNRGATGGNAQVRSANPSPPVTAPSDGRSGKTAGSKAGREIGVIQPRPTERLATVPKIGNLQRQAQPQVRQVPKPQFQPATPRTLTQPSPQARSVPRPQAQSMPQRLSTPQFQPSTQRTFTPPSPQARSVPRPQAQSMTQRLSAPQFQPASPRTFTPPQVRPQIRQAPQRQFQAPPQRMSQPQPQTRQMSLPQVRSSRQTPTQDSRGVRSSRNGR